MNKKEMTALVKSMRKDGTSLDKIALAIHKRRSVVKELLGNAAKKPAAKPAQKQVAAKQAKKPVPAPAGNAVKKPCGKSCGKGEANAKLAKALQQKNAPCKACGYVVCGISLKVTKADAKKMCEVKAKKAAKDKPETKGKAKPAKKPAAAKKPAKK